MGRGKKFLESEEILEAIKQAIPKEPDDFGKIGNEPVFRLCQHLKGIIPEGTTSNDLDSVVMKWWELSRNVLCENGIEDFMTVWVMFTDLWDNEKVKFPKRDSLQTAIARAKVRTEDRPELVSLLDEKLILLGHVCYELQKLNGDNPFFLSGEDAGKVMGKCDKTGGLALKYLQRERVIEKVKTGHTGRASEYSYIGQYQECQQDKIQKQIRNYRNEGDL